MRSTLYSDTRLVSHDIANFIAINGVNNNAHARVPSMLLPQKRAKHPDAIFFNTNITRIKQDKQYVSASSCSAVLFATQLLSRVYYSSDYAYYAPSKNEKFN
jgi:hypothetical protein